MPEVPPPSPERREETPRMFFHIPKIHKNKLASELGASPKDFSKQRREFKEWFEKTFSFEYGDADPESNEKPLLHVKMSPNSRAICDIPDPKNLFLYLKDMPADITEKEFLIFLTLYQQTFQIQALEEKARILSTHEPDQEEKLAQFESENIILTLIKLQKMPPMHLPEFLKKKLQQIPEIDEDGSLRQSEEIWSKKRPGIGMLFIDNIVSQEQPEHDIPYLDELLCYYESMFFSTFIATTRKIPLLWGFWVVAHADLLVNTDSETYKLFCAIFNIPEGGLFEKDGSIRQEVWLTTPADLHEGLVIVERKKQESVQLKNIQESNKQRINEILSNPLPLSWNTDYTISSQEIPPEIKKIFVTIRRGKKAIARTSCIPEDMPLDLKQCTFEVFDVASKNTRATWQDISQWKGGETYSVEVEGIVDTQRGKSTTIYTWKEEKRHKETATREEKNHTQWHPTVAPTTPTRIATLLHTPPIQAPQTPLQTAVPEIPKDPKEAEKEDLGVALELFLEKSREELLSFFQEHAKWDSEKKTLTFYIPIEELEELGYTPSLLSVSEYGPMTQWTVQRIKEKWTPDGKAAPEKVQTYYEPIFRALSQKIERGEIDNYLSGHGLSPSETNDNSALRSAVTTKDAIDTKKLLAGIAEISRKYVESGVHNNLYHGQLTKEGMPTSISWLSKGQWLATLKLHPEIAIQVSPLKKQSLPYDAALFTQRVENAILNFIYQYIKNRQGISSIIKRTTAQEDTRKLRESYRRDLRKKTARLLIENPDGITFSIIEGISKEGLATAIRQAQIQYGAEKVALLYRRNTYIFLGDTSICKPSQNDSDDDYMSLALPERRNIIHERILKTLFNGKSGIQDRAPFLYGSAVYHALQFEVQAFQEKTGRDITREDITDEFLGKFITLLRSGQVLISYRDYCADDVANLTDLVEE